MESECLICIGVSILFHLLNFTYLKSTGYLITDIALTSTFRVPNQYVPTVFDNYSKSVTVDDVQV